MQDHVIITARENRVGIITLNRPKVLNALNDEVMNALGAALTAFDADDSIGVIVIEGSSRAFAAGADIIETNTFGSTALVLAEYPPLHEKAKGSERSTARFVRSGDVRSARPTASRTTSTSNTSNPANHATRVPCARYIRSAPRG